MSILVVCTGCKSRFQVSEKFAGKQGPCPKCKTVLTIPQPDEVKIHMPEEYASGGKGAKGQAVAKPIARKSTKISAVTAVAIIGGAAVTLVVALIGGEFLRETPVAAGAGLLAVSIPLAIGGYSILRNDELEPYAGRSLWIRAAVCGLIYSALWGGYAFIPDAAFSSGVNWLFIAPPFLIVGAAAAYFTLDLPIESAFFHFCFFVLATMVLRWAMGLPWLWEISAGS